VSLPLCLSNAAGLTSLAPHVFILVANTFALVGFWRPLSSDSRGDLTHHFLINSLDNHSPTVSRDTEGDRFRRVELDRMRITQVKQ
jgi:hypothetical protein